MTGYSGTPLSRKLGIGVDSQVGSFGAPAGFEDLLTPLPEGATVAPEPEGACDVFVVFADSAGALAPAFERAAGLLPADGGLWVAWPKKSSGVATDLTFEVVQRHGLDRGLVDNKVCAIDATWSGLRFVVRRADRATWPA